MSASMHVAQEYYIALADRSNGKTYMSAGNAWSAQIFQSCGLDHSKQYNIYVSWHAAAQEYFKLLAGSLEAVNIYVGRHACSAGIYIAIGWIA